MSRAYSGLAGQYDAFTGDVPYSEFADFYESVFRSRSERPRLLLDLACGTGTLALEMTRRGYELIAAYGSSDMLSEAACKLAGSGALILCQPMTELDLYGTVDAVYSSLDSFNYLSPGELPEVLRRLALFTAPGGLLIFDVNTPERFRSLDGSVSVDESDGALCLWRADFDEEEGCLVYGMDLFTRSGSLWRREQEEHVEYAHGLDWLRHELEQAGFYDIEVVKGPQADAGRVFFISRNGGKGMKNDG